MTRGNRGTSGNGRRAGPKSGRDGDREALRQARAVLAAGPIEPYPDLGDLEAASVNVPGSQDTATLVCMAQLADSRAALGLLQYRSDGVSGTLAALLAWQSALEQMLTGAYPATALSEAQVRVADCLPDVRLVTGVLAILNMRDCQIAFSSAGAPLPGVYPHGAGTPLSQAQMRPYAVHVPGASLGENKLYLKEGDWFVAGTAGLRQHMRAGAGGGLVPSRWLGSSTASHLAARVHTVCRRRRAPAQDVAMLAVHVPAVSARTHLARQLGFGPGEPVTIGTLHYYEDVDQGAAGVLRAMDRLGYRDTSIRQMKMALAELLVNALEHGNRKDPGKRVVVGYDVDAERTKVSVMDEGKGFNPASIPDPTMEGNLLKDRGRGLFLVRHFTDELVYNAAGNRATVVKKFTV